MPLEIFMATYNGQNFIQKQIESILSQSFQDYHLFIGDDASTDKTQEIIEKFTSEHPDKITFIPFEINVGANANFSRLIEMSEGDYIMLADQDDIWHPDKIAASMEAMQMLEAEYGKDEPLLVYSDLNVIDETDNVIHPSWKKYVGVTKKSYSLSRLLVRHAYLGCTLLFNKELYMLSTPIPLEAGMHDYWITLIATLFGKIKEVDHPLIDYRLHKRNVIGARPFDFKWFWNEIHHNPNFVDHFQQRILKAYARAFTLYKRYQNSLDDNDLETIEKFVQVKYLPYSKELFYRIKYGFWDQTFWQNMILLYATKKMGIFNP